MKSNEGRIDDETIFVFLFPSLYNFVLQTGMSRTLELVMCDKSVKRSDQVTDGGEVIGGSSVRVCL